MKSFRSLILTIAIGAVILPFGLPAVAQPASVTKFSGVGTGTTTLSYFAITANAVGTALVKFVDATSDATSVCQFYSAGAPSDVTAVDAASQAVITASGTGFSGSDVILVRHVASDTYQRLIVSSATSSNITATANLTAATAVGDLVYKMTKNGSFTVGATNKQVNAGGGFIYAGQQGRPVLVETTGSSACALNLVSGSFEK